MSISARMTLEESKLFEGKYFFHMWSGKNVLANKHTKLVLRTGTKNIVVTSAVITGSADFVTWSYRTGTVFDDQTGTKLSEVRSNPLIAGASGVEVWVDPTITDDGTPVIPVDIDAMATVSSHLGQGLMNIPILSNNFIIPKLTSQCVNIQNRQGTSDRNILFTLYYYTM